jgi:hypothetical protein
MSEDVIIRRRVHVATSVKGVVSPDVTVEITGPLGDAELHDCTLREIDKLYKAMSERFPAVKE